MKRMMMAGILCMVMVMTASLAQAYSTLTSMEVRENGSTISPSGIDPSTGLGTISLTYNTPGSYNVLAFLDHEIDLFETGFFPEYGTATGKPATGQSWEIDEPGYVFGDIYGNFLLGSLDNGNGVLSTAPDDVSMALGWNFTLDPGYTALLKFIVTDVAPSSAFFLAQTDSPSGNSIYFYSTLTEQGGPTNPVPEPSTFVLLGSSLAGVALFLRKRKNG